MKMRKLGPMLIATVLTTAGLVAVTPAAALAAPTDCTISFNASPRSVNVPSGPVRTERAGCGLALKLEAMTVAACRGVPLRADNTLPVMRDSGASVSTCPSPGATPSAHATE